MADAAIAARQVELLYRNIPVSQLVSLANATLLVALWREEVGTVPALFWWLAVLIAGGGRVLLARAFAAASQPARIERWESWQRRARLGALMGGLTWAAGALLFTLGADTVQQTFTGFVMAGMVAGAVPVLAADRLAFRLYGWPVILATAGGASGSDALHVAFMLMALLFLAITTRSAEHFRHTLQESLRLESEKDALLGKLDKARQAAELANRAKTEFLANVSHELRTPMNGIVGMAELLALEELSPGQGEYLAILRHSADELLALINDLIELSALEAGHWQAVSGPFAVPESFSGLLAEVAEKAAAKSLRFEQHIDAGLPDLLVGDIDRVRKILAHLTDNAVKFTERGHVELNIRLLKRDAERAWVEFTVSDSGPGIVADKLEAIFRPFNPADGSVTRRHSGAGIGLPICRRLAELLAGELSAESQPGRGSVFRLRLPFGLAGEAAVRAACPDSSAPADRSPA